MSSQLFWAEGKGLIASTEGQHSPLLLAWKVEIMRLHKMVGNLKPRDEDEKTEGNNSDTFFIKDQTKWVLCQRGKREGKKE